ncbi:MAG: Dihydrolipoamide dehydrogenase [Acidimicrobiaceae bacterium]|nr:Dihydrolipoamide dehydrogenase [Acidimicrobiaceae bacterium]
MSVHFVIVGGGPAGVEAASTASRLGASVTLVERDVVGGAANLWDCIPSKAMIATGGAIALTRRSTSLGISLAAASPDLDALCERVRSISERLSSSTKRQLESQGVRVVHGSAKLVGPHKVQVSPYQADGHQVDPFVAEADAILLATGSTPRVPEWAGVDGDRILVTRQAYPPPTIPEHLVVVGSGVTGVEFVHMFRSLGSRVTLIVSRQQVLPMKDPEVAAALESDFLDSGVTLVKGARAVAMKRSGDEVAVMCEDGRSIVGSHALLAIGSIPSSAGLGLDLAGVETNDGGYVPINHHCQSNVPHVYAAGDLSGRLPLASVAAMQGRKVAEHVMGLHTRDHRHLDYDKAASAIFTEPEIADVGLAEAEAFALGRKIRVTKVPFAVNAKAMIDGDPRGFVKLVSDPSTGVVLGGSIVGAHAAELISVIAVAVTAHLRVDDLAETVFVHPALAEALSAAAE